MTTGEATDETDFDDSWIQEPFADPSIRQNYMIALGRLILAHNEVDFWLSALLTKAAAKLEPDGDLVALTDGTFHQRATNFMLLMRVAPNLRFGDVGNGKLLELNKFRNLLAHGHFNQDPYEGTFELVSARRRGQNAQRVRDVDASRINAHAKELEDIASHMAAVNAFFEIDIDSLSIDK